MKRKALVAHLKKHSCILIREGAKHSVFHNPTNFRTSTVPRHSEIDEFLCRKICRDLGIAEISQG